MSDRLSLIIFPEGTRSADGQVNRFKAGSFLLALEAGLTIVPLSVSGSRHVMQKGRLMTCPGHVTLQVHEPIAAPRIESPTADDAREFAIAHRDDREVGCAQQPLTGSRRRRRLRPALDARGCPRPRSLTGMGSRPL